MIRSTTNGVLKTYRRNLSGSFNLLNKSRDTVLSQRNFNSFAEDPATAAQCFKLRRSFQKTSSQYDISNSVIRKYEVAYSSLESVVDQVDNTETSALHAILRAENSPTAAGVSALGTNLKQIAETMVQTMNCRYSDNYVFSGADGLNVPFTWDTAADGSRTLKYRGQDVTNGAPAILDYMSSEAKYEDIGLGLSEDAQGLVETSAFNTALQGINFLGYGINDEGQPNNLAVVIYNMGEILSRCDADTGKFEKPEDQENFQKLLNQFETGRADLKNKHVELSTRANFLKTNHEELATNADTLNEQILDIEQVDLADAITAFSWAQYCYNAALKVGNSILTESLIDYMR